MTLSVDATTTHVQNSTSPTTVTLTPAANSLLMVAVWTDNGATQTVTVTDSGGPALAWTLLGTWNGVTPDFGTVSVWTAPQPSSASRTIQVTSSGGAVLRQVKVDIITDSSGLMPNPGVFGAGSHSGTGTITTVSVTAGPIGSIGFIGSIPKTSPGAQTGQNTDDSATYGSEFTYLGRITTATVSTSQVLNPTTTGAFNAVAWTIAPPTTKALTDTATASDAVTVTATVPLTDTATIAESVGFHQFLTDTAAIADSITTAATIPLTDTMTVTDSLTVHVTVGVTDTMAVADAVVVTVPPGVPMLHGAAQLTVEGAFGADLSSPGSWVFTDLTADVHYPAKINIVVGRGDETSQGQPATCNLTLLNTANKYSAYNPTSLHGPTMRRGTPIRVTLTVGADSKVFLFYAIGFTPAWDTSAKLATVIIAAAGTLRRLGQGKTPLRSPLYRSITADPHLIAYWTMEDAAGATAASSGLAGGVPLKTTGTVNWAQAAPGGSAPLPSFASGGLTGRVPTSVGSWCIEFALKVNQLTPVNATGILKWTSGSTNFGMNWSNFGPPLNTFNIDVGGSTPPQAFTFTNVIGDGDWHMVQICAIQVGADFDFTVWVDGVDQLGGFPFTITGVTLGAISTITVPEPIGGGLPGTPDDSTDINLGHLAVSSPATLTPANAATLTQALTGYTGETADDRITRLCGEEGISLVLTGTSATAMGPQPIAAFLDILREAETTDGGVIYDGFTAGIGYICRSARYNLTAALILDLDAGDVGTPFGPVDDDQRTRNDVTASRSGGGSARVIDTDGPLGTDAIGTYDTSISVNTADDTYLPGIAAFGVNLGTVDGLRYPGLALDLGATPGQRGPFLRTPPISYRADVIHITDRVTQHPPDPVKSIVEGFSMAIDLNNWAVAANCSPYAPWRGLTVDSATHGRIDASASTTGGSFSNSATTVVIASPIGLAWTTLPADFPLDLNIAGERITVSTIDAGSVVGGVWHQNATVTARSVNGVVLAHAAGEPIHIWEATKVML